MDLNEAFMRSIQNYYEDGEFEEMGKHGEIKYTKKFFDKKAEEWIGKKSKETKKALKKNGIQED